MQAHDYYSLIHPEQTEKSYSGWAHRIIESFKKSLDHPDYHYHGERHSFAHERYSLLWHERTEVKIKPPVEIKKHGSDWRDYVSSETGLSREKVKEIDHEVRHEVSRELGHERENITRTYLG